MNHFPLSIFRLPSSILRLPLPLPFPERRLVLMALDLLAVNGALFLALALVMQTQVRRQRPTSSG
jgi:hypothetical protein